MGAAPAEWGAVAAADLRVRCIELHTYAVRIYPRAGGHEHQP